MKAMYQCKFVYLENTSFKVSSEEGRVRKRFIREGELPLHDVPASATIIEVGDDSFNLNQKHKQESSTQHDLTGSLTMLIQVGEARPRDSKSRKLKCRTQTVGLDLVETDSAS